MTLIVTNGSKFFSLILSLFTYFCTFALGMDKDHKETIRVRAISVGFAVLALGVFKPFGLGAWKWDAYVHLLLIWVLGFGVCFLTEVILRFVAKMPRSNEQGVDYIIHRNLWFQLINTPLVSLMICLYRHFILSDRVPNNQRSWSNFLDACHHRPHFLCHRSVLALQVPQSLSGNRVGRDTTVERTTEGNAKANRIKGAVSRRLRSSMKVNCPRSQKRQRY